MSRLSTAERQNASAPRERSWAERQLGSRFLHRLGDVSAHAAAGLTAAGMLVVWIVVGAFAGFPSWWATILQVVSSSVTLMMVFTIQHTQARQQAASQRKLDELLRSAPHADDRLIAVEEAPDAELTALADQNLAHRERANRARLDTDDDPDPVRPG